MVEAVAGPAQAFGDVGVAEFPPEPSGGNSAFRRGRSHAHGDHTPSGRRARPPTACPGRLQGPLDGIRLVALRASSLCGCCRTPFLANGNDGARCPVTGEVVAQMSQSVPVELDAALPELAGLLMSTDSFEQLLQGVAELAVRVIDPVATCGITLAQDDRVITIASADALASQLDEQQYEHESGPCLQALTSGEVVEAADLVTEERWEGYPTIAMAHGILAILSNPLIVEGKPVGVLNLYARSPRAFSAVDRQLAGLLAGQAAIVVTAALRHYDEVTLSDHLRIALSSRSVIDQAIGIVMAQRRCGPEVAFATLRTISQRRNIKLRTVAAELVDAVQSLSPNDPPQA